MFPTKKKQQLQNEFDPGTLNPPPWRIGLNVAQNCS